MSPWFFSNSLYDLHCSNPQGVIGYYSQARAMGIPVDQGLELFRPRMRGGELGLRFSPLEALIPGKAPGRRRPQFSPGPPPPRNPNWSVVIGGRHYPGFGRRDPKWCKRGASVWPLRYGKGNIRDSRDRRPERESLGTVLRGGGKAVPPGWVPSVPAQDPSGPQSPGLERLSGTWRTLQLESTCSIEPGHEVAGALRAARVALGTTQDFPGDKSTRDRVGLFS